MRALPGKLADDQERRATFHYKIRVVCYAEGAAVVAYPNDAFVSTISAADLG